MIKKTQIIPAVTINFMAEETYEKITPASDELYAVELADNISIPYFTPLWQDHKVNDLNWLRGDTFSWQSGDIYVGAYNELLSEYTDPNCVVVSNEETFVQPVLTSDGIVGGDDFACEASSVLPGQSGGFIHGSAYYAFDGDANTAWHSTDVSASNSITFYSPYLLKATNIQITNWAYTGGNTGMKTGTVEASNDNSTWVQLATFNNSTLTPSAIWDISLSSNTEFYQYYKITCTSSDYSSYSVIGNVNITGTYINPNSPIYKITPKGYKIADATQELVLVDMYNNTGVAWYYILDTNNTRFKLPRTKFGFTGLRTNPGTYVEPGLPNITGYYSGINIRGGENSGALYTGNEGYKRDYEGNTSTGAISFDASRSNSIYGNTNTVQPPATQMYLYFYVGGTGRTGNGLPDQSGHTGEVLTTNGSLAEWKPVNGRNIGETVFSLVPLTDACLHLLDGSLLSGTGSYADFVTYMAGIATTYPNLFASEADWQTSITTYGICGKFVYDSVNNTLRLPRVIGIIEGTLDPIALGDLVEAGLPNITGTFQDGNEVDSDAALSGAFFKTTTSGQTAYDGTAYPRVTGFDASRSSSIYGNSTTVQPQTIKGYYYIVVANSIKPNYVLDVDQVITDLNNKADKSTLSSNGLYITTYRNGTEWYREYFSDASKTQRVWLEQGGLAEITSGYGPVTFLRTFSNTNYTCVAILNHGTTVKASHNLADIVAVDSCTALGCRILGSDNEDGALTAHASWVAYGI